LSINNGEHLTQDDIFKDLVKTQKTVANSLKALGKSLNSSLAGVESSMYDIASSLGSISPMRSPTIKKQGTQRVYQDAISSLEALREVDLSSATDEMKKDFKTLKRDAEQFVLDLEAGILKGSDSATKQQLLAIQDRFDEINNSIESAVTRTVDYSSIARNTFEQTGQAI